MKRPPLIATMLVTLAIAAMIALGVWQLERRAEKAAARARQAEAANGPAIAFPALAEGEAYLFRRAGAMCLAPVAWERSAGHARDGSTGWRIIAVCRRQGLEGPPLRIELGIAADPRSTPVWRGGRVTGRITQAPGGPSWVARLFGARSTVPLMLVADAPPVAGLKPSAPPDPASVTDNHLAYAVQWFLFAGIAGVIYLLALRQRSRRATARERV